LALWHDPKLPTRLGAGLGMVHRGHGGPRLGLAHIRMAGLLGAALAILTLGAYRQGWRDRGSEEPPKTRMSSEGRGR